MNNSRFPARNTSAVKSSPTNPTSRTGIVIADDDDDDDDGPVPVRIAARSAVVRRTVSKASVPVAVRPVVVDDDEDEIVIVRRSARSAIFRSNALYQRVVVIAPTRSTCVNIATVLEAEELPLTLLEKVRALEMDAAISDLANSGFGVVAGTGTGKTVAIRDICQKALATDNLRIAIVTREYDPAENQRHANVFVITPGVSLNWLKDGRISKSDLIIIDEIHQTSEHLELSMALAKKTGCRFVWMSATIDPEDFKNYLGAETVITCDAFDPTRKARVEIVRTTIEETLDDLVGWVGNEERGVAVFVPSRGIAEKLASQFSNTGIHTDFYHGGESADKLRPYLTGKVKKPFMIFMTIAGASSLNIVGLDTVVIVDQFYSEVVLSGGVKSLQKQELGNNELLQMGGRVNGRAKNGKIVIVSDRKIDFHSLRATAPDFVLGGNLENTALICARLGIDIADLDLIGEIDIDAYDRVVKRFCDRGIISLEGGIHLTELGERVERLPLEPAMAELLVKAQDSKDEDLFHRVLIVSCIGQLYRLHKEEWDMSVCVCGSDHLTAYNIIVQALLEFGYVRKDDVFSYRLRDDRNPYEKSEFMKWCDEKGFFAKEIRDVLMAVNSVYRHFQMECPDPESLKLVECDSSEHSKFVDLLARVQSLDFVHYQQNSIAGTVWAAKGGMNRGGYVLGKIRYWNDKREIRRASIEGTEIPLNLVMQYSSLKPIEFLGRTYLGEKYGVRFVKYFAGEPIGLPFLNFVELEDIPAQYRDKV
ncbi:MAG: DEAD/DEAH box helicase [Patescibacteria group bacterium]|jgi:hypothetical protein